MVKTPEPRIVLTWNMRKLYLQILNHARSLARWNLTDHEHNSVYQREPKGPTRRRWLQQVGLIHVFWL